MQVRGLEHLVGNAERNPVDEVALPQLERRDGRDVESREVLEVVAERNAPPFGLERSRGCPPPPQPDADHGDHEDARVDGGAGPERDQHDVAQRRDGLEAGDAGPEQDHRRDHEREQGDHEPDDTLLDVPPQPLDRLAAASLNRLKRSLFDLRCSEIRSRNSGLADLRRR